MKIRCITNRGDALPESYLKPEFYYTQETDFPLTIGKEYVVYAFYTFEGNLWYYICDDSYTYYPMQNPAPLFEVVDSRMSQYWRLHLSANGLLEFAFEEWFSDPYFYDKLTDQDEAEVLIFERIKKMMDIEAYAPAPLPISAEYSQVETSLELVRG